MSNLFLALLLVQEPVAVAGDEAQPGLIAVYRSLVDPAATLARIDLQPAFTLNGSSPHPRIPPGPIEVGWTGLLLIQDKDAITIDPIIGGEARIVIAGARIAGPLEQHEIRSSHPPFSVTLGPCGDVA